MDKKTSAYVGQVEKKPSDKSIIVVVNRRIKHPLLGKYYNKKRKFMVHDEDNRAQLGNRVSFVSCRPISKRKSHKLQAILEQ